MQKTTIDFEALRLADEHNDAEALAAFYAEDAEVRLISKDNPPSSPYFLRGRAEISEHVPAVCGRNLQHRIENEVVGEDRVAFNEVCEYPDGTTVLAATTMEMRNGEIARQLTVEAWDE